MYDRKNRELLGRTAEQLQQILNAAKNQGRQGLNGSERQQYERLTDEFTRLEEAIQINEGGRSFTLPANPDERGGPRIDPANLEELQDTLRLTPGAKRNLDHTPHAKAFSNLLRAGERLNPQDRQILDRMNSGLGIQNAQSTTTGSQGGDLVPQGFSEKLEEAMKWFGGIEGTVETFETGSGNTMPWPTLNDTTNRGRIIGQNTQMVETDLVFGQTSFSAYIGSSDLILVPLALIDDSFFDLDKLVARIAGTRIGRLFNQKCTVGTGTGEPTGIVTAATTAGNILTLGAGNTASVAYANLVDLQHLVDPAYRENPSSKWMFSDAVLKLLKKLTDSQGRPLWQPGISASFQDGAGVTGLKPRILDREYVINQDMAAPAASAYTVLFGDMSTFKVRKVSGGTTLLVLRERYADYLQVGYTAFQRFDSNLIDAGTHPLALMQQSAN